MLTKAIVRLPPANFAEGLTTAGLGTPNYERALSQHKAYCAALEKCGLSLTKLEADERHPDSCFVEDTAVLIRALPHRGAGAPRQDPAHALARAVLTRPGAQSRQGEVRTISETFDHLFPGELIHQIQAPATLEGGDVCEAGDHLFIGLSERTNEAGAAQLSKLVSEFGYRPFVVDIRKMNGLLHLKSAIAYLGDNRLVVTEAMTRRKEFSDYDLIWVPSGEEYAANCVRINNCVLIAAGYRRFETKLRELGYQTIALEMSEFQKMDGGLSCLSLRF